MTTHTTAPKRIMERPATTVLRLTEKITNRYPEGDEIPTGGFADIPDPMRHPRRIAKVLRRMNFGETEIPEVAYWLAGMECHNRDWRVQADDGSIMSHQAFEERFTLKANYRPVGVSHG